MHPSAVKVSFNVMNKVLSASLSIFFLSFMMAGQQPLNADEKKIIEYVDANLPAAISLIEQTVNIDSATEDLAGVKAVGAVLKKELEALGLNARWIEMPAAQKRAGHLVAETKGTKGKRLLLLGHLDTVLRGEKFRREGNRVFGTGVGDMKGGNVIAVHALKTLHSLGLLKDIRIIVMFTGDEESSCDPVDICRGDMIAAAKRSDLALSFEAAIRNTATVGRRGSSSWTLEVDARTGHSSGIFRDSMGYGAIFEATRILNEFREKLGGEKYLTFNPSLIVGGTTASNETSEGKASGKTNVVPAKVIVKGDLRFISEEQKNAARNRMREIVSKNLPGATAKIGFDDGIPAMTPVEGNYEILKKLDQVSRDLGLGPVEALDPGDRGAGDIAFISGIIPGLDGIGMGGSSNSHAKGESASIENLGALIKRAAVLIYRLSREQSPSAARP
jgi:glutamate carboxypeptidase